MPRIRIATFNCENLFARYKFKSNVDPDRAIKEGWETDKRKFHRFSGKSRSLTASAIRETKADVIALQEVENMSVLKKFRTKYLQSRKKYPYLLLIDGNDPRRIDVAVLSKYPLENIDTHINAFNKGIPVFSRDCLECDVVVSKTKKVRLYVNHFKSMMDPKSRCRGRATTRTRRKSQADYVKKIISKGNVKGDFVILGDFNDYLENDSQGKSAIRSLVNWSRVENVAKRLPPDQRWTHYWKGNSTCGISEKYTQLDYILISKSLTKKNKSIKPKIMRKGMTTKAKKYSGKRFSGVSNKVNASDHAPMVIELNL